MSDPTAPDRPAPSPLQVGLIGLFVTALVTSQLLAAKLLAFEAPVSIPLAGSSILLPGAALAYALTFFASDCYAELYGRSAATTMVNVAFLMNLALLGLVWSAIAAPVAADSPVTAETFRQVLAPSTGFVVASMVAYLVSQNWDVVAFHRLRAYTDGRRLWLRNLGSTASSQLLDTVLFITIGFGVFQGLPAGALLSLIVGQYLFKLLVAVADTPFVYLVVGLARSERSLSVPSLAGAK